MKLPNVRFSLDANALHLQLLQMRNEMIRSAFNNNSNCNNKCKQDMTLILLRTFHLAEQPRPGRGLPGISGRGTSSGAAVEDVRSREGKTGIRHPDSPIRRSLFTSNHLTLSTRGDICLGFETCVHSL